MANVKMRVTSLSREHSVLVNDARHMVVRTMSLLRRRTTSPSNSKDVKRFTSFEVEARRADSVVSAQLITLCMRCSRV